MIRKKSFKNNKRLKKNKKSLKISNRPSMEGGFIRSGSTQYFPVNCTKIENNESIQQNNHKFLKLSGGSSNVWRDLLKMSIIPSINLKKGGKYNRKTLKNKLYQPIGIKNINTIMKDEAEKYHLN